MHAIPLNCNGPSALAFSPDTARALLHSGIPEKRTDGYWNNVSQCCGAAGVAQFFLDLHGTARGQRDARFLDFAKKMTADDLKMVIA